MCGHCQFGPDFVCKDGPVFPTTRSRRLLRGAGALSDAAQAEARGVEVRLVRRLPAHPARLRGRAARARGRGRDRLFPRGLERDRRRAVRPLAGRRLDHDAARRGAHPEVRRASSCWSPSAPAPPRAASRRCGTSRTCAEFLSIGLCHARVHRDAGDLDADRGARRRRLRAPRLPDQQAPAARGDQRLPAGRRPNSADHSVCIECKLRGNVCVMVAHGTPCLGPVTQAGCGATLPGLRPRLLRLLRPEGDTEHRVAGAPAARLGVRRRATSCACSAPSTPAPSRSASRRATSP